MARHPFTVPDQALWDDLRASIRPLRLRSTKSLSVKLQGALARPVRATGTPGHSKSNAMNLPPPPLAAFDRRTAQKLARGQLEPEARLDLHGETLEAARIKLLHFLERQQRQGLRLVLVITGKGASPFAGHTLHGTRMFDSPERLGRLRRELPHWLDESLFRSHVIGFQPAHPRHGGGGAFYIRLRRMGNGPS